MLAFRIAHTHRGIDFILGCYVLDMDCLGWVGEVEPSGDFGGHFLRCSDDEDLMKAFRLKRVEDFLVMIGVLEQGTLYGGEEVGFLLGAFSCKDLIVFYQKTVVNDERNMIFIGYQLGTEAFSCAASAYQGIDLDGRITVDSQLRKQIHV